MATSLLGAGRRNAFAAIDDGETAEVLVAAVAGSKIRVTSVVINFGATAVPVTFNSAAAAIYPPLLGADDGLFVLPDSAGYFETAAGEALTVTTGAGSLASSVAVTYELAP